MRAHATAPDDQAMQRALPFPHADRLRLPALAARVGLSFAVVVLTYLGAARVGRVFPFAAAPPDPYAPQAVERAIPYDAPLPEGLALAEAGHGDPLAYHSVWTAHEPPDQVGSQILAALGRTPKWSLTEDKPLADGVTTHLARVSSQGQMTHFAELSLAAIPGGTRLTFDFTPIPTSFAPEPR